MTGAQWRSLRNGKLGTVTASPTPPARCLLRQSRSPSPAWSKCGYCQPWQVALGREVDSRGLRRASGSRNVDCENKRADSISMVHFPPFGDTRWTLARRYAEQKPFVTILSGGRWCGLNKRRRTFSPGLPTHHQAGTTGVSRPRRTATAVAPIQISTAAYRPSILRRARLRKSSTSGDADVPATNESVVPSTTSQRGGLDSGLEGTATEAGAI